MPDDARLTPDSADTPRLTSDERQALRDWWEVGPGWDDQDDVLTRLQRVVGRIVAGRLAPIETTTTEIERALRALVDENEGWEWSAPVGPGNASYANGYENGRRAVGAELRDLLAAFDPSARPAVEGGDGR